MNVNQENANEKTDLYRKELLSDCSRNDKNRLKGKKRNNPGFLDIGNFKMSILRTKKMKMSNMKLGKCALEDMDDCMSHLLEKFLKELKMLQKKGKGKNLSVRDVETVVKLCLPRGLGMGVSEYARKAADAYFSSEIQAK